MSAAHAQGQMARGECCSVCMKQKLSRQLRQNIKIFRMWHFINYSLKFTLKQLIGKTGSRWDLQANC